VTVVTEISCLKTIIAKKGTLMLRRLFALSALAFAAHAHAAEAGKVIFTTGAVTIAGRAGFEGAGVQEGELLSTGADGYLYIKTVDNGLFVLRPNTEARIAAYQVDTRTPSNTHVKLELLKGTARSKSGDAVKQARQNFRFNTPVAAIGVRGTDFTVYTDQNTSRIAVLTGGVVVSGFAGSCRPDGVGPCEGAASRELSATQRNQLLQVQRGQAAPQLLSGGIGAVDQSAPPRADEPVAKAGSTSTAIAAEPALDPQKSKAIDKIVAQPAPPTPAPPGNGGGGSGPTSPVPDTPDTTPPPPLPDRQLQWGRWTALAGNAPTLTLSGPVDAERIIDGNFVMYWTAGKEFVSPAQGSIGFALKDSEAYITTPSDTGSAVKAAQLSNGTLNVDFGSRQFTTAMDLSDGSASYKLQATGAVAANGGLYGNPSYARPGYIDVQGGLSNDKGGSAAYLFHGFIDATRTVNGATSWTRQ
jgi:hypothetical protein